MAEGDAILAVVDRGGAAGFGYRGVHSVFAQP